MEFLKSFEDRLNNSSEEEFNELALALFTYQAGHNLLYKQYIQTLGVSIDDITNISQIPFLPISFFKSHQIKTASWESEHVFESSGTTGMETSKHQVNNLEDYLKNASGIFQNCYGDITDFHFLALLPSYLERNNSSLVFMMDHFIKVSDSEYSGFYLDEIKQLIGVLEALSNDKSKKTVLVGVTFALLDMVEKFDLDFPELIVMETGGMKGRRKEMIREEVHALLKKGFGTNNIHSEYGMTELLSQAYSKSSGVFHENEKMKIIVRDINDPLTMLDQGMTGGLNIIDLANIHTCGFIETQDMGRKLSPTTFEVLGRFDNSDVRGCSLMTV
jgi:phenylacetate-coenzyme A ligase PaaK-like adenylate-forming protein